MFGEGGEYYSFNNLILNRNALNSYVNDPGLTAEQNARMQKMTASLALYLSLNQAFSEEDIVALGWFSNIVKKTLNAVAVVSFAIANFLVSPAVVALTGGASEVIGLAFFVAAVAAEAVVAVMEILEKKDKDDEGEEEPIPVPEPQPFSVSITLGGEVINPDRVYYLENGEELVFNFQFYEFDETKTVQLFYYDPADYKSIAANEKNAGFYAVTDTEDNPVLAWTSHYQLKIKRQYSGAGYQNGTVDFVINFGEEIVINGSTGGTGFQDTGQTEPVLRKDIFILHFTLDPAGATP
jgi:hypothetical protein